MRVILVWFFDYSECSQNKWNMDKISDHSMQQCFTGIISLKRKINSVIFLINFDSLRFKLRSFSNFFLIFLLCFFMKKVNTHLMIFYYRIILMIHCESCIKFFSTTKYKQFSLSSCNKISSLNSLINYKKHIQQFTVNDPSKLNHSKLYCSNLPSCQTF